MQKRNVDPRQRKQARYDKKNRRKKQRRRVILGVLLAAVGLAAAGGLWFLEQRQGEPAETTIPAHQQTQPLITTTEPKKVVPSSKVGS